MENHERHIFIRILQTNSEKSSVIMDFKIFLNKSEPPLLKPGSEIQYGLRTQLKLETLHKMFGP